MPVSIICEDLTINGNIKATSGIEIRGLVVGDIVAVSVEIGISGAVDGNIDAKTVEIHGSFKGSVSAKAVTIHSQAIVDADISADEMSLEHGCRISGNLNVTGLKDT